MKHIFLSTLGLCLCFKGFSQVYHPIPTDSVYWIESLSGPYMGSSSCIELVSRQVRPTSNTTVINGHLYTTFECTEVWNFLAFQPWACPAPFVQSHMFYVNIWNDTLNRKVYANHPSYPGDEILLYDFDVSLGDTLYLSNAFGYQCQTDTFTVLKIDSIDIGGEYRRRIGTQDVYYGDTLYMIEGVGSTYGLAYNNYCPFEYNTSLVCYHYKNLEFGSSTCVPNLSLPEISVSDYLKPASPNVFWIENPENIRIEITVIDLLGNIVIEKIYLESGYVDLSNFTPGIYILYLWLDKDLPKPFKVMVN